MAMNAVKISITISALVFLFCGSPFAMETLDFFDELIFADLQVSAMSIDLLKYLKWHPEDKGAIKRVSERNLENLKEIKGHIRNLVIPDSLAELKVLNLDLIDKVAHIYTGIEAKTPGQIRTELNSLEPLYMSFAREFEKRATQHAPRENLPKDFDPTDAEGNLAQSKWDRHFYITGVDLIGQKEYEQAFEYLGSIKGKYEGEVFGDCIVLRISDCKLKKYNHSGNSAAPDVYKETLEVLSRLLERGRYSPVLFETFYKWRTLTQHCIYGEAKSSEIPNMGYNEKRWELVKVIKEHLVIDGNDLWARNQIDLFLSLPNITRSSKLGNDNLKHLMFLYTDVLEDGSLGLRKD